MPHWEGGLDGEEREREGKERRLPSSEAVVGEMTRGKGVGQRGCQKASSHQPSPRLASQTIEPTLTHTHTHGPLALLIHPMELQNKSWSLQTW